jgi:hypothetical protein
VHDEHFHIGSVTDLVGRGGEASIKGNFGNVPPILNDGKCEGLVVTGVVSTITDLVVCVGTEKNSMKK